MRGIVVFCTPWWRRAGLALGLALALLAAGCREYQGYLYARPMPAPALEAWHGAERG